jgi:hypothetical protein
MRAEYASLLHPGNQAKTPRDISEWNAPTETPDPFLSQPSVMHSIEPRDSRNSWVIRPILPLSASKTVPLEANSETGNVGQNMTKLLKEQVQEMAKADPRHVSRQGKQRDAFIEIRLCELHAEDGGARGLTARKPLLEGQPDAISQKASHYETVNGDGNSIALPSHSSVICHSDLHSGVDADQVRIRPELSCNRSGLSPSVATEGMSIQMLPGNQHAEMVWTQDMNPASQNPKQTRSKEDKARRLEVRRRGGACPKHKSTKKAVSCPRKSFRRPGMHANA